MAKDKESILDLKDLEGTALLDFYQIFPDDINDPDFSINIHGGTNGIYTPIVWQGLSYTPIPLEASDFEVKGDNSLPRPKIKIANIDLIMSQYLKAFDGLINAKVVRKRVFAKYLDEENFSDIGFNPFGDSDQTKGFQNEVYFVNRKVSENQEIIELELSSSLELENIQIPRKTILASYCPFAYRGDCCGYTSSRSLFEKDDTAIPAGSSRGAWVNSGNYSIGDVVFRFNQHKMSIVPNSSLSNANDHFTPEYSRSYFVCKVAHSSSSSTNPLKREDLWTRDECGKLVASCKIRQGSTINYGGYVGTYGFGV